MPQSPNFKIGDDWGNVPRTITEKDLELLCRYDEYSGDEGMLEESENGEFVRWDSLIQLLK